MKLRHAIVAAICGSALVLAAAPGAQAHVARNATADSVPAFGNVFVIIGENTTYGELTKYTAPYVREHAGAEVGSADHLLRAHAQLDWRTTSP